MRRWYVIGIVILLILGGIAIGVGAYNAGVTHGLEQARDGVDVVRYVGPGFGYGFPFGLILFPLFIIGIFALVRAAFWRRWDGHHHPHGGPGRWGNGAPPTFEEWHRRQHEQVLEQPSAGAEPAAG